MKTKTTKAAKPIGKLAHRVSTQRAGTGKDGAIAPLKADHRQDDDPKRGHGGWLGDPEGHSRATARGWEGRRDDDDRGRYSRSGSRRGHGGWLGDPEGHSRAAARGWEGRRDDDDRDRRYGFRDR